jgi:hypothetical protein
VTTDSQEPGKAASSDEEYLPCFLKFHIRVSCEKGLFFSRLRIDIASRRGGSTFLVRKSDYFSVSSFSFSIPCSSSTLRCIKTCRCRIRSFAFPHGLL